MLESLRKIVQRVSATDSLQDALHLMVSNVRCAVDADAATLFLIDNNSADFLLMASDGHNKALIGHLRFGLDHGLVGLVGRREEPINLLLSLIHI